MRVASLFARPELAGLLVAVAVVFAALAVLGRARAKKRDRGLGPRAAGLVPGLSVRRRHVRLGLFVAALSLAVAAAMRPVWGVEPGRVQERAVDVVVCLDVSRSMLARDLAPSRLSRARTEIAALAKRAEGGRLGLVVFAGEARLLVPLTRDAASFARIVADAGPLSVARGGTDLAAAISTALAALPAEGDRTPAILLLTDGDDPEGTARRAAEAARRRGVAVHCLGLGTALGAKIPVPGPSGETFLTDRSGAEVVTKLDADALRAVADAARGRFVAAGAGAGELVSLYESRILPEAGRRLAAANRSEPVNRFQWPLLLAVLLWLTELSIPDRRR